MSNILKNSNIPVDLKLSYDEYWDFCLDTDIWSSIDNVNKGLQTRCLVSYIDINNPNCVWFDRLYSISNYIWENSVNNGVMLNYIGCTGVDNGLINYEKDRISNEKFYKLFTNSILSINANDMCFQMKKVYGNNMLYDYINDIVFFDNRTCAKLNGGFFQGFFKLSKCNLYQVLPDVIEDSWSFEFTLRKEDFDKENLYQLNDIYPNNKGMFFYIGTRAENKWWINYKVDEEFEKTRNTYFSDDYVSNEYDTTDCLNGSYLKPLEKSSCCDGYFSDGYLSKEDYVDCCLYNGNSVITKTDFKFTMPEYLDTYKDNYLWNDGSGNLLAHNVKMYTKSNTINNNLRKCCESYFADDYINDGYKSGEYDTCDMYVKDGYVKDEMYIDVNEDMKTSEGYNFSQPNITEIKTDNKFITFHHGEGGFNVKDWNEDDEYIITDIKIPDQENYFLKFYHGKDGYTIKTIREYERELSKKYNVLDDIFKNALVLQIKDDGYIGYKYLVRDCDSETKWYKIESEFSKNGIIKEKKWVNIHVRINKIGNNKMKLFFYVNGKLCLISKELPMIELKTLNDLDDKQQGVPYNISIGGGTQGLCDVIYLDYRKLPEYVLPLEKEFAGSFIGYISSFKMYNCQLNLNEINENYNFEINYEV